MTIIRTIMRISSSRVSVICSWLATLAFMAGFMVFIVQPWTWAGPPQSLSQAPVAQGLQSTHAQITPERAERRRRRRKLTPAQREERRRARLVRDQAEYRQWRRSVEAGGRLGGEEEDTVDSAVRSLWEELFSEPLDIRAPVEDDNYDEAK